MRRFFAAASLFMLLVVPEMTKADMIYDIQDYPSLQTNNGVTYHISGTITTDGFIGAITDSTEEFHITSWVVTFSGGNLPTNATISSSDPGAEIYEISNLTLVLCHSLIVG